MSAGGCPVSPRPITERGSARTSFDGNSSVVHVAPDVREDFGLQPELADSLAILAGLFRSSG